MRRTTLWYILSSSDAKHILLHNMSILVHIANSVGARFFTVSKRVMKYLTQLLFIFDIAKPVQINWQNISKNQPWLEGLPEQQVVTQLQMTFESRPRRQQQLKEQV